MCHSPIRDRTHILPLLSTTLCAFTFLFLVIRLACRRPGLAGAIGLADGIITLAFVLALPIVVFTYFGWKKGLGKDIWMVDMPEIPNILRLFYLTQGFYVASVNLVKIAILMFFHQAIPQKWFQRTCLTMIGIVSAFGLAFIMFSIFQCHPINHVWNQWDGIHPGKCINIYVGSYINASLNMLIDVIILLMPVPVLLRLQLSTRRKVHIFAMFNVGAIVTIFSSLRVRTLVAFGKEPNPTWTFVDVGIWSISEIFVGIICACLPATKVFLFRLVPQWLGFSVVDSVVSRSSRGVIGSSSQKSAPKGSSNNSLSLNISNNSRSNKAALEISRPVPIARASSSGYRRAQSSGFAKLGDVEENIPLQDYSTKPYAEPGILDHDQYFQEQALHTENDWIRQQQQQQSEPRIVRGALSK